MRPKNETTHRHAPKASPARRRVKPKFEVPAETGSQKTAAAWVYRADEVPAPPPSIRETEAPVATGTRNPVMTAGMSLLFFGVGTIGLVSLAALGMIVAPFRFAGSVWD